MRGPKEQKLIQSLKEFYKNLIKSSTSQIVQKRNLATYLSVIQPGKEINHLNHLLFLVGNNCWR